MKTIKNCLFWGFIFLATAVTIRSAFVGSNLWTLSDLIPITIAAYEKSALLYRTYNQILAWIKNNTVSLTSSFHIYSKEFELSTLSNSLDKAISSSHLSFSKGSTQTIDDEEFQQNKHCRLYLQTENQLKFSADISLLQDFDDFEIVVSLDYQLSYRQLKSTWKHFKHFKEVFMRDWKTPNERNDLIINMSSSDLNPFYRLTLKSIDAKNLSNVNLSFREGDSDIKITKNKIYVSSPNSQTIDDVINQIVPMTRVY